MATGLSEEKMKDIGLEAEQVEVLMKCFNGFCKEGVVRAETVGEILHMMGLRVKKQALLDIIDEVDEDGKFKEGVVRAETVGEILHMMGLRVKKQALLDIIDEVDEDGSGQLEFEEFCILAARFLIEEDEEQMRKELKEAFRFYDKDGVGYLSIETLKGILLELEPKLGNDQLMEIVAEVDEDGSGTIDFDEFMNMMMG